jgi:hypothetical protein
MAKLATFWQLQRVVCCQLLDVQVFGREESRPYKPKMMAKLAKLRMGTAAAKIAIRHP